MILTTQSEPPDLRPLLDASKSLLGYRVHGAFKHYFDVMAANVQRWHKAGLISNLLEPPAFLTAANPFDLESIDLEYLTSLLGIYFYLYMGHKSVNERLMLPYAGKRVLYLRGYDFAFTSNLGSGQASEARSVDTQRFNATIGRLASNDVCLFKVMSPDEAYQETLGLEKLFLKLDLNAVIQNAKYPFRSAYLNALAWKEGVLHLIDRADYFVVYVSSLTPSAMWELDQLDTPERRHRVTIVFDFEAIAIKGGIVAAQEQTRSSGVGLISSKSLSGPGMTPEEFKSKLAAKFVVISPQEFEQNLETHRTRISQSSATRPSAAHEKWIEFKFHPALPPNELASLQEFCAWIKTRVLSAIEKPNIPSLLLFLNDCQFWIYTTLLLGEHDETGRALAIYAATLNCFAAAFYVEDHVSAATYWGITLLAAGKSHEFSSIYESAQIEFEEIKRKAATAVTKVLENNEKSHSSQPFVVAPRDKRK